MRKDRNGIKRVPIFMGPGKSIVTIEEAGKTTSEK